MQVAIREPRPDDWPGIHAAANAALPWASDGNATWLANRRQFDEARFQRRHYVAEDSDGTIRGYAAVEGDTEPGRFRVFLVTAPERLNAGLGQLLYERLEQDLAHMGATTAWARE